MSLSSSLNSVVRPKVPSCILDSCLEADKIVVENILTVLCDAATTLSITQASIERKSNSYVITIPLATEGSISYNAIRQAISYSPARVQDVLMTARGTLQPAVVLHIGDEKAKITSTEVDVIRLQKRMRWSA